MPFTAEQKERIAELRAQHMPYSKIADEIGATTARVAYHLASVGSTKEIPLPADARDVEGAIISLGVCRAAAVYCMTRQQFRLACRQAGIVTSYERFTDEDHQEWIERRKAGESFGKIAKDYEVSSEGVRKYCVSRGVR